MPQRYSLTLWSVHILYGVKKFTNCARNQVRNTGSYTYDTWVDEMRLAQYAHIDAFAFNIAQGESMNQAQLGNAFRAVVSRGFKLFFSFDYAGRGPWGRDQIEVLLSQYLDNPAYYTEGGVPLVSTFE